MRHILRNPIKSVRMRFAGALLALVTSASLVHAAVASSSRSFVAAQCIHRQKHLVADGKSPSGRQWTVTASIRDNGGCSTWLFSMDFRPSGTLRGSSRWSWRIPAGGHLSKKFTIDAQDESAGPNRAFYGAVGGRVKIIVLTTSNGKRLTVHPKLPSLALRERFVWLRNVRYVLRYYPSDQHVRVARLFNAQGDLVGRVGGSEGEFAGGST